MFLAKKRIAIAREEGREVGRAEEQAASNARIAELTAANERMREEIRLLREARSSTPSSGRCDTPQVSGNGDCHSLPVSLMVIESTHLTQS